MRSVQTRLRYLLTKRGQMTWCAIVRLFGGFTPKNPLPQPNFLELKKRLSILSAHRIKRISILYQEIGLLYVHLYWSLYLIDVLMHCPHTDLCGR